MGSSQPNFLPPQSSETVTRRQLGKDTRRTSPLAGDEKPPWKEGDRLGNFVLEQFLGRGSSGYVYRVCETGTNQRHALKLLLPGSPEDLVRNKCGFRRMRSVIHPGLVHVHRLYRLDEYIGLTMEEVHGKTLKQSIDDFRSLPIDERFEKLVGLTRQYASALACLHSHGLVHRDIKPQNLMVDDDGNGRIVDYGLVGTFDPQEDPNGFRHYYVGSPNYLAPETCWDRFYLPAGDVFSLGLSILQVARQMGGHADVSRSDQSRSEDRRMILGAIEDLDADVPDLLREACGEMLEPRSSDRPTAQEIARLGLPPRDTIVWTAEVDFIGRKKELERLRSWFRLIATGGTGRLHIRGDSGMGKSLLLEQIVKEFPGNGWVQVFYAKCLPREDEPLQAFDQLIDEIVARFMKSDREPIPMDVASAATLHDAFPALKSMITPSEDIPPAGKHSERYDALEAGVRLAQALAKFGPLVLIVDDVHWADRDSLNTLDALQSTVGEHFGIITASRGPDSRQRVPPDASMTLEPIPDDVAMDWLNGIVRRWNADVTQLTLMQWVSVCGGCPLDLQLVADELKPGGFLSKSDGDLGFEQAFGRLKLWRRKIDGLSREAREVLELICIAGRPVTYKDLGGLTGCGEAVDVLISELAHERLVLEDAIDSGADRATDDRVRIAHNSIAEGVLATMAGNRSLAAHRSWANRLIAGEQADNVAGRIAGHLFDAEESARAVPYANEAAEHAERQFAMTEAARWRERTLPQLTGAERLVQLRQMARCFDEADRPAEAARYYSQLADAVEDPDESVELELMAVARLIRCGQVGDVRRILTRLGKQLNMPVPKSAWKTKLSLLAKLGRLHLSGHRFGEVPALPPPEQSDRPNDPLHQRRVRLCLELIRPLTMFDNAYAGELHLAGTLATRQQGSEAERLHFAAGAAVFGAYNSGPRRESSRRLLTNLRARFEQIDDPKLWGDYHGAWAFYHAFQCDWFDVIRPATGSVAAYRRSGRPVSFEIFHTRWLELWSYLKIGQINQFCTTAFEMHDDAIMRADRFAWLVTTGGLGNAAWLAKDDLGSVRTFQRETLRSIDETGPQWLDVFNWLALMQTTAFEGNWSALVKQANFSSDGNFRTVCRRVQFLGIFKLENQIRAELGLWHFQIQKNDEAVVRDADSRPRRRRLDKLIRSLRRHALPYTEMLANHFSARLHAYEGNHDLAKVGFDESAKMAAEQKILPLQLAAPDWMDWMANGSLGDRLSNHLTSEGVASPECFRRLFD